MARKSALVVCPGRGTYNKDELGYLARHHADKAGLIGAIDAARLALGQETVSALDGADRHTLARHTRGDNASPLIYACAYADFLSIDRERLAADLYLRLCRFPVDRPRRLQHRGCHRQLDGLVYRAGLRRRADRDGRFRSGQHHGHADAAGIDRRQCRAGGPR
jgi:hypothetical protein